MKNKILHNTVAVFLALIVVLPFAIQTFHGLQHHEHKVCTAKDVRHFHDQDADCSIYHLRIEQRSMDLVINYDLDIHPVINLNPTFYFFKKYQNKYKYKSSRAPPGFIV